MSNSDIPLDSGQTNAAQLFTNSAGLAVFADRPFMTLLSYPETFAVVGKPLYQVLGIEQVLAQQLFDQLRKAARLEERLLEVRNANGLPLRLVCSGVASVDAAGKFLGADFRLRPASVFAEEADATIVRVSIDQDPEIDNMFLQLYFTTRVKALYVMLGRLIGPQVNDRLDRLINDTAKKNNWNVKILGGLFTADVATTPVQVYKTLLKDTQTYAENLIGQRMVARGLAGVQSQLHPGVLSLASRYGLYEPEKDQ